MLWDAIYFRDRALGLFRTTITWDTISPILQLFCLSAWKSVMPKFIVTVRSISGNAFAGGLGPIRYLSVPDGAAPAPAHQVARTEWVKQVMQTFVRDASGNATGDLLFLVHGFNNDFTSANTLHDQVTGGLAGKLVCTIVSFDWPSAGETFAYLEDLDTAKRTAVDLVNAAIRPLIRAQTDDCRVAV